LSLSRFAGELCRIQFSFHLSPLIFGELIQGIVILIEAHVVITLLDFDDVSLGNVR